MDRNVEVSYNLFVFSAVLFARQLMRETGVLLRISVPAKYLLVSCDNYTFNLLNDKLHLNIGLK